MTRGVLMYAHNNTEIDYFKIACANALMVQKNLQVPVTLVTDSGSLNWGEKILGTDLINQCFENVLKVPTDHLFKNPRNFFDTSFTTKTLSFYNCNHWQAYNLSPYDETLFIDVDYLIMSPVLNMCWNTVHDVMINNKIYSPGKPDDPYFKNIDEMGIKLYWATVIYFKKTPLAEQLFSMVRHIQENYQYYKDLYCFNNGMFRNDNAFSVAIHTLNGFSNFEPIIKELPIPGLLMSWDTDDIHGVHGVNDISLYSEKGRGEYIVVRLKETDVHIMNKWAINRHADKLISIYK